jgi:hypothetical protein
MQILQKWKNIFIKRFSNFWHRIYSWQDTQHIQKLATEDLNILRYCRSRVFTFVYFMQKLTGTSSGKNNKSCGIFHNESKKIGLLFVWFFYDFLRILKYPAKALILFKNHIARRSLETLDSYKCTLALRKSPRK